MEKATKMGKKNCTTRKQKGFQPIAESLSECVWEKGFPPRNEWEECCGLA